jgi:hypothetical protein
MLAKSFTLARVITMELGRTGLALSAAFLRATAGSVPTGRPGLEGVGLTREDDAGAFAFSGRDAGVTEGRNGSVMRPSFRTSAWLREAGTVDIDLGGSFGNVGRTKVSSVPLRSMRSPRWVGSLARDVVRMETLGISVRVTRATRSRPIPSLMIVLLLPTT